jgi:hypothetical protein
VKPKCKQILTKTLFVQNKKYHFNIWIGKISLNNKHPYRLKALDSSTLGMAKWPPEAVHLKVHISMNSHPGKPISDADVL